MSVMPVSRHVLTSGLTCAALVAAALVAGTSPASAATSQTFQVGNTVALGGSVLRLAVDPSLHTAYVADYSYQRVSVIDEATNTVTAVIPTGAYSDAVAVDAATHTVYVANGMDNTVSVIDGMTNSLTTTVTVGAFPYDVTVDESTHMVYVVNQNENTVSVIDGSTNTVTATIGVGSIPTRVAVDPVTHDVYVANQNDNTVWVIDGTSHIVRQIIPVNWYPTALAVDPALHTLYVGIGGDDTISQIDTRTLSVRADIPIGGFPGDLAVDASTHAVYVTEMSAAAVSVIDGPSGTVMATVPVGSAPFGVAVDSVTHTAYAANNNDSTVSVITSGPAGQVLAFTSSPTTVSTPGQTYTPTVSHGTSGVPVTISVDSATTGFGTSSVACTSDGSTLSYVHVGSCVIDADQAAGGGFTAAATIQQTASLTIATSTITFTAPTPAGGSSTVTGRVGASATVTADGTGPGRAVTLSVNSGSAAVCSLSGSTSGSSVTYLHSGVCIVDAAQVGTADYTPVSSSLSIAVTRVASVVSVALSRSSAVYGQPVTATATVATTSRTPAGAVQFTVDGVDVGAPVPVVTTGPDRTATSADLTAAGGTALAPGAHQITGRFLPGDTTTYLPAIALPQTLAVAKSATTTLLTVNTTTLVAVVTPVAPGAGTPTGAVSFFVGGTPVGSATLVGGTATLVYATPAALAEQAGAQYAGSANFALSTADTTVHPDPSITAEVTSAHPRTHHWYRSPVTITFTCVTHGAELTRPCPDPVTVRHNHAGLTVSRSIMATDGGMDAVSVTVNLDRSDPHVRIRGVDDGARYVATAPNPRCVGTDALSGIASCRLTDHTDTTANGVRVSYTATATDRAGNTTTTDATVRIVDSGIVDAHYRNHAYTVHAGRDYTLVSLGKKRPRYVDATPYPGAPAGLDHWFHRSGSVNGHHRWVLTVTMTMSLLGYRYWNVGIKAGHHLHVVKVRVVD